jgi:Protein of unknown function (DUF1360)
VGTVAREAEAYKGGEDRPLGAFAGIMAAYGAVVGVGGFLARRRGLPERVSVSDLALLTVATHKVSRLLAKDPVTSPLRAPFTRFEGTSGEAELAEEVRGTGARKAMGELVTCPFCLGHWIVTGFGFGFVFAPEATRLAAAMLTAEAGASFLQHAHAAVEQGSGAHTEQ